GGCERYSFDHDTSNSPHFYRIGLCNRLQRIVELIKSMEIKNRTSGRELLALSRSVGVNVRINTTIQIEDLFATAAFRKVER
ncbi:MAG TPA: hypothetical protein VN922_04540, partial [Bacteroidia bacterium]|nr:hypothetical protein [Bacteroidia bacterium]